MCDDAVRRRVEETELIVDGDASAKRIRMFRIDFGGIVAKLERYGHLAASESDFLFSDDLGGSIGKGDILQLNREKSIFGHGDALAVGDSAREKA